MSTRCTESNPRCLVREAVYREAFEVPKLPEQPAMSNALNRRQFSALSPQWGTVDSMAAVNISTVCQAAVGPKSSLKSFSVSSGAGST
jgi:hypothetical protein